MTFPINPHIFGIEINTHLTTEILAFFIGYRYYVYQRKKITDNFTTEQRLILLVAAAFGALIFSRLIAALENHNAWLNSDNPVLYLYGTKTVIGGFLGGWLFVEIAKGLMKLKKSSGDVMTLPIILALFIGRIGCFSQGIHEMTYGYPTSSIFGMNLGDGILRHPLALYEMFILLVIALSLHLLQLNTKLADGMQFKLFMYAYMLYRFIAEWMKPHYPLAFGLTSIQIAILIAYCLNFKTITSLIVNKKSLYA